MTDKDIKSLTDKELIDEMMQRQEVRDRKLIQSYEIFAEVINDILKRLSAIEVKL
jgi:ligand-binding sensor protein